MLKKKSELHFSYSLLELVISLIVFGMVSSGLITITELVDRSFDKGITYSENGKMARVVSLEVSEKIRSVIEQIYPDPSDSIASYTVFKFYQDKDNLATAKIAKDGNNNLLMYNCQSTSPYNEITSNPAFSSIILATGVKEFRIQFEQERLASFSITLEMENSSSESENIQLQSQIFIRAK
ncbi:hypothetical protein ACFL35_06965 [Candidatus Riflebacteria bacterium]